MTNVSTKFTMSKVVSNICRYVNQASLIYILATCHPASLAEEMTWAPLPPAKINLVKCFPTQISMQISSKCNSK